MQRNLQMHGTLNDGSKSSSVSHLRKETRSQLVADDRTREIERENRILLEKMRQLYQHKNSKPGGTTTTISRAQGGAINYQMNGYA